MSAIAAAIAGAAVVGGVATTMASNKAASAQEHAANTASNTQLQMYNTTRQDQAPWRAAGGQAVNALSQWYGLGGINTPTGQDGYDPSSGNTIGPNGVIGQIIPGGGNAYSEGEPIQSGGRRGGVIPRQTQTSATSQTPDYNAILSKLPGYQFQLQQGNEAVQRNLAASGLLQSGAAGKALEQYGQGVASNYATQYVNGLQSLAGLGQTSVANTGAIGANTANQIGANQIYSGNAQASGYAGTANAINSGLSGITGAYGMYNSYQNAQPQWNAGNSAMANYQSNQAMDQFANQPVAPLNLGGP